MGRYMLVSIVSGILFGVLDGLVNGNPLAQRLYEVYKPIARTSISTSPAPGEGSSFSLISSTSGPPARVIHICFMAAS